MSNFKKILVSVLAAAALCPALNVYAEISEKQNKCPDFSEIRNIDFDSKSFDEAVKKIDQIVKYPDHKRTNEVKMLLKILVEQYTHLRTVFNICSLSYYSDVSDYSQNRRYMDIQNIYNKMYDDLSHCCADLCEAGFSDALTDVNGYDLTEIFLEDTDYDLSDEEFEKILTENNRYINEINDIINQYYSYTEDDFSVEYNDQTWILSDILNYPPSDDNDCKAIATLIHNKKNEILGNIYLELLNKRNRIAKLYGYDNYAEYAYEKFYIRDYSTEDTDEIYTYVKDNFAQLGQYLSEEAQTSVTFSDIYDMDFSEETVLNTASDLFERIDFEIWERFEHLRSRHLYDMSKNFAKSGDSFMNSLYDYDVPFMFISPREDYYDLINVIHEFGHANAEYVNPSSGISDERGIAVDTSEMHSQGMEVLFTHYSGQLFGVDNGRAFNRVIISNLIDSILHGCLFDEFQKYAYMNPNCTLEQLNAKYKTLCKEYGVEYSEDDPYTYDWVDITHNYANPMYYISYASSAVSVLDLWIDSMNDIELAIKGYNKITDCDKYTPYLEAAEKCGLATLFDKDALAEIAYQTEYYFDNDTIDLSYKSYDADYNKNESTGGFIESKIYHDKSDSIQTKKHDIHHNRFIKTVVADDAYDIHKEIFTLIVSVILTILVSVAGGVGLIITILVIRNENKKKKSSQSDYTPPSNDKNEPL